MKKNLLLAIELLFATMAFSRNNERIEIPFTMDKNLIIIKVELAKNTTHSFVFDTGTEGIMLIDSIANLYQYKSVGLDTIVNQKGEFVATQEKILIPELNFAGLKLSRNIGIKMPRQMLLSNEAVGIIGMQTFMGYTITLDYKSSKLILQKGNMLQQPNTIPINVDRILEAKVKLNNQEVLAHFDCGGAGYISIPKGWNNYKLKSEPVLTNKGRTPMGDFDVYKAELDGSIQVGSYQISNPKINLVTGDFFYSINFGYEFFRDHLITIDTKNKLMTIKESHQDARISSKQVKEIDQLIEDLSAKDKFSGNVLIAKGNEIIYQKAVGYADKEKDIKNNINTKFNLASMNKMFTGLAIAQLVEKNKLSYSDKIVKYLPYLSEKIFGNITIEQLLTHTSGTGDIFRFPKFMEIKDTAKTIANYVDLGISQPLLFEPGTKFQYSNYGYILLGALIEKISKMSYFEYVKKNIFSVARMENTDSYENDRVNNNMAIGYATPPPMPDHTSQSDNKQIIRERNTGLIEVKGTSAGGGYSTVLDLHKFSQALLSGKLLSIKNVEIITKGRVRITLPPNATQTPDVKYGFGFGEFYRNNIRVIGHNGGAPGVEGQVDVYPDTGYTVIVLSNFDRTVLSIINFIGGIISTKQ